MRKTFLKSYDGMYNGSFFDSLRWKSFTREQPRQLLSRRITTAAPTTTAQQIIKILRTMPAMLSLLRKWAIWDQDTTPYWVALKDDGYEAA